MSTENTQFLDNIANRIDTIQHLARSITQITGDCSGDFSLEDKCESARVIAESVQELARTLGLDLERATLAAITSGMAHA